MPRPLPTGFADKSLDVVIYPAFLVELDWPSGALRLWTGYGTLSFDGNTYTGSGTIGNISPISESTDAGANGVTFSVSGIPSELISDALANNAQGRPARAWFALLNADRTFTIDPLLVFDGVIDTTVISDSGTTATIAVQAEKELINRRAESRRANHEDQQIDHPGDLFFDYVAQLQDAVINWGTLGRTSNLPSGGYVGSARSPNNVNLL
jgi:hypothetical protein